MQSGIEWFYCKWIGFGDITIFGQVDTSGFRFEQVNDKYIARPTEKTWRAKSLQIALFYSFSVKEKWHLMFFRLLSPFKSYWHLMFFRLLSPFKSYCSFSTKIACLAHFRMWKWSHEYETRAIYLIVSRQLSSV